MNKKEWVTTILIVAGCVLIALCVFLPCQTWLRIPYPESIGPAETPMDGYARGFAILQAMEENLWIDIILLGAMLVYAVAYIIMVIIVFVHLISMVRLSKGSKKLNVTINDTRKEQMRLSIAGLVMSILPVIIGLVSYLIPTAVYAATIVFERKNNRR